MTGYYGTNGALVSAFINQLASGLFPFVVAQYGVSAVVYMCHIRNIDIW